MSARGRRRASMLVAGVSAVLAIGIGIPANVVASNLPATLADRRVLWVALLVGLTAALVVVTLLSQKLSADGTRPTLAGQIPPTDGWVERDELDEVVRALTVRGGSVALTTGLAGAGGFGKTTLAAQACRHQQVVRRFKGKIVWITVGQCTSGADLAARISETIRILGGDGTAFTGTEQAGQALAAALSARGGRFLVVVDDVWTEPQLAPFKAVRQVAQLLVTTRRPQVLDTIDPHMRRISVDGVDAEVARQILRRGLRPPIERATERELLDLARGYPLLLRLINRRLADDLRAPGGSIGSAAAEAVRRLREDGRHALDVADDQARESAVAATIDYSLGVLTSGDQERFRELGVFSEDAEVPVRVVGMLWKDTAGLTQVETATLCDRLDGLPLISLRRSRQELVMHDVIRDYAARGLGGKGQQAVHAALINAARSLIGPTANTVGTGADVSWWRLPRDGDLGYLWEHLTYHPDGAGATQELDSLCSDLRFAVTRLQNSSPAALEADLTRSQSPRAGRLRQVIAQNAHLLGPVRPPGALAAILTSRLGAMNEMAAQLPALREETGAWTAWLDWPLPDQGADMLLRTLAHGSPVLAVAVAPDGSWLASGGEDGTIQVWAADGMRLRKLDGHPNPVCAMVVAPDGSWLATGSIEEIRVWAVEDWTLCRSVPGSWELLAVKPDSSRLIIGKGNVRINVELPTGNESVDDSPDDLSVKGMIRAWGDSTMLVTVTSSPLTVNGWASTPEGNWRVHNDFGKPITLEAEDGTTRTLAGSTGLVAAVTAVAGNGWLASGGFDGTVGLWTEDGSPLCVLEGHAGTVCAVAAGRDGVLLASGGDDHTVRI